MKKIDAVVDQRAPVASAHQVALLLGEAGLGEGASGSARNARAMRGLDQPVQELVEPIALHAARAA